jgi:hypothetical protein
MIVDAERQKLQFLAATVKNSPNVDLSNGGCYLAPSNPRGYRIIVEGNGFSGNLDAQCAGIVATLFVLSHLSMRFPNVDSIARHFHQLRDFACGHPRWQPDSGGYRLSSRTAAVLVAAAVRVLVA